MGDFRPDPDAPYTTPAGKATIEVKEKPKILRNLKEWILSGTKLAPEAVETRENIANPAVGVIPVVCLASPAGARFKYAAYFFEFKGVPLVVSLDGPGSDKYRSLARETVASLRFAN